MKRHQKVLQLNSNLSKLIDSLCFQLSVNLPDQNSLSLIEILQWRTSGQINQQEFKELYSGWLQSKNIFDLFTVKQIQTYPKEQLLQFEGPIKKIFNVNQITKILEILNNVYNEIYLQKRIKGMPSLNPKNQIKAIEQVQKLFSTLDNAGIINLRLSEMFFLTGSILISQNKPIPIDFKQFKQTFKTLLQEMGQIHGCVSLRNFKNYFLIQKGKPLLVKNLNTILTEIQNISNLTSEVKQKSNCFPNLFEQSIQKWKSYPYFKNQQKKVQFLKRLFEENQQVFFLDSQFQSEAIQAQLTNKYGKDFMTCLQIDSKLIEQYMQIFQDTLNKYINLFQKISNILNKNKASSTQYINQSSVFLGGVTNSFNDLHQKKKSFELQSNYKNISKTAVKQRTPQKKRKNNHDFTASNNYRNRTPTHKNTVDTYGLQKQFGSAQKKINMSGYGATVRQSTPTKSTLSFMTDVPRTYRAAQKRGLLQNNFYDKLFFFRNKRVQSYEIVMKRLKNK